MIVKALYLLFLLTFLVLPFFYHRKKSRPSMTKFYLRMAFSHNFRKCYRLVLLSALLMFHFYHLSLFKLPLEVPVAQLKIIKTSNPFCCIYY